MITTNQSTILQNPAYFCRAMRNYFKCPCTASMHAQISCLIVCLLLLAACARQGAPTGGPTDVKPPAIDTLASSPNFSTRFNQKKIELKFDEWVVLADAASQIVVSPPLATRPEVVLKGRTVVFSFDKNEVLRPNTTYTINFGSSVKDLHEGNPAKDLRFVFSTGDFIDSLMFRGALTDAYSGDPLENISIMLYENMADSAVRKERPYYFSRTDKAGNYAFKNLRSGTFRVVAIDDTDQNLKWDGENERIAFLDSALVITDSLLPPLQLKLFKNAPKFRLSGQNANRYGLVKLNFNLPPPAYELQMIAPPGLKTLLEKTQDSLMIWYDLPVRDTAWTLILSSRISPAPDSSLQQAALKYDTVQIRKISREEFIKNHRVGFGDIAAPAPSPVRSKSFGAPPPKPVVQPIKTIVQPLAKPAVIPFNVPIIAVDTSAWRFQLDSTPTRAFKVVSDSLLPRQLSLQFDWKQGAAYTLKLLPGAVTDFWGVANTDTLTRIFNVLSERQLGKLSLTVEKLQPGRNYILQLLNGTILEEERTFLAETSSKKLVFDHLQVAAYSVRLIEDINGNGRWDSGNFALKRQPEPVFNRKLDPLRANWELELSISTETISEKKRKKE